VVLLPEAQNARPRAWGSYSGPHCRTKTPGDDPGLPSSWRTLMCLRPVLRPRRARHYQAITVGRHGPTRSVRRGLSTRGNFGAQSHGISTSCLRFAPWVAPKDARLASGCWPALPDGIGYPQGSYERFLRCCLHHFPPFSSFLAQTLSPYLSLPLTFPSVRLPVSTWPMRIICR
jgi:hypothetical protein